MELDYKLVGERIKLYRKRRKWTQQVISEHANLSKQYFAEIEAGRKEGRLAIYYRIAKALDVSLDILVSDSTDQNDYMAKSALSKRIENYSEKQYKMLLSYMDYLDFIK